MYLFSDSTVLFMLLAYLFDSRQIICLLNTNYAFVKALTTAVARNWHTSTPPIDLHLIFEKSSLKNPVGRTWFLIILNLKFAGSQAVKINFEIDQKLSLSNLIFQKSSRKNLVPRTGSLVHFELDFYCLCSLKKSILKLIFAG